MRSFRALKQELEFSSIKNTQLLRSDISNKKKPYQIADSKVKRQLKIFDGNEDGEKLITNLANMIKFRAQLPCKHNLKDSNKDFSYLCFFYDSSALGRTV